MALAQALYADPRHAIAEICTTLRASRSTLYRYITAGRRPPADSSATRPDLEAGPTQQ
ncbi:MAG: helix-turn-helix domain-containing protein [Actinomycetota bacterium]|nr:helix-turn-helix domain-containing protein [Actinomycetota bacterium]